MDKLQLIGVAASAALFVSNAMAGEIDGVVRDRDGFPAEDLIVRLLELDIETATDSHGHFHFDDVTPGEYTMEIVGGAETLTRRIVVGEGVTPLNFRVGSVTMGRIIVQASPLMGRSPLDMARPVTVLGGDDLARKTAASIGETVAAELGVSATSFGPGASRPVIRGLGDDRVRVLQGGIGALDVSTVSDDHGVTIEPILADQVEVLRGPATLLYGTGAIGGVVNVVDNRIPERMPSHALEGRAEVRGVSVNGERTGVVRLDGRAGEHLAWHVHAYSRDTDDIGIPGFAESARLRALEEDEDEEEDHGEEEAFGSLPNSDLRHKGAAIGASWITGRGYHGLSVSTMDNAYGIPGGHGHEEHEEEEEEEEEEAPVRIDQEQTRVDFAGSVSDPFAAFRQLRYRFGYNDYTHTELEGDEVGTVFTNKAWEGRVEATHDPVAGGWTGAVGLQASGREFSAIGDEAFTPPVDSSEIGVFWVEERDFKRLKLELGTRIERVEHDPATGPQRAFTLKNLSAGVILPVADEVEVVLNTGRFQRAPVSEELYSDGPHLASGTFELGDPTLGNETSNTIETGIRDQVGDLRWSATVFRTEFDDFIYQEDTGTVDPDSDLPVLVYRQQDADFTGVELEVITRVTEGSWGRIDTRAFGDKVTARLADRTNVPRIPPHRYGVSVDYTRDDWFARVDWTHHRGQDRVAPGELPTSGYDMLNVDLNYRVYAPHSEWFLFLRGTNLLDEDARRHTSFLKDVAPLPGRSVQAGVRVGF